MGEKGLIGFVAMIHSDSEDYIRIIQESGYDTSCYLNAIHCLNKISEKPPDIICVDLDVNPGWNANFKYEDLDAVLAFRNDNFRNNPFYCRRVLGLYLIERLKELFPGTPIIAIDDVHTDDLTHNPDFIVYDLKRRQIGGYLCGLCDEYINRTTFDADEFSVLINQLHQDLLERTA